MNISFNITKKRSKEYFERMAPMLNTFRWMEQFWDSVKDKTIFDIVLPGTHDSGSYSCNFNNGIAPFAPRILKRKCIPKFIKNDAIVWTKTQDDNLLVQCMGGARYLDLRVCISVKDREIRTEHSIYGEKYLNLLNQIQFFIKSQQKEFIILHFRHFSKNKMNEMTEDDHKTLINMINKSIGKYCVFKEEIKNKLNDLLKINHRIFIIYDNPINEKYDWLISGDSIWNKWTNTQTPLELTNKLTQYVNEYNDDDNNNKLFCLQSCITPNDKMIKQYILKKLFGRLLSNRYKNIPMSLHDVGEEANSAIIKWIESNNDYKLNIISFDCLSLHRDLVILLIYKNIS